MTTMLQDQDGSARLQRAPRVAPIHVGTAAPLMLDNVWPELKKLLK